MNTFIQGISASRVLAATAATCGVLGALVVAYGAAKANPGLSAAPIVLLIGLLLSAYPRAVLWLALAIGLVAAGLAKLYVPALEEIRWFLAPLSGVLVLHVLLRALVAGRDEHRVSAPPLLWWAAAVGAAAFLATLVSFPDLMQVVRGFKGYFQVWGLLVGLAFLAWPDALMRRRLPQFLLVVAFLQLPFVVHQYLVLVPHRATLDLSGLVPVDVIAGTFGAQVDGGGANSMLAAYMFVVLGGLAGLWQRGQLSGKWLLIMGVALLAPMLVNSAKVSLVYALVLFAVLFGRDVVARPMRFMAVALVVTVGLAAMYFAYSSGTGPDSDSSSDSSTLIARIYEANVAANHENRGTFTRAGALRYWGEQHFPEDVPGALLGHGLYASRHGSEGVDLWDAADPSLGIKNTAVSAVLWDAGILGLVAVFALVLSAYATAARLERRYVDDPWLAGLFLGAKAAMAIIFVSLWVKSYFTYHIGYQTMFVVLVGWLAYWDRRSRIGGGGRPA